MDRWEYQVISLNAQTDWQTGIGLKKPEFRDEALQAQLNELGASGWECIAFTPGAWSGGINNYTVSSYHVIFKRRAS